MKRLRTIIKELQKYYDAYVEQHDKPPQIIRLAKSDIEVYRQKRSKIPAIINNAIVIDPPLTYRGIEVIENKGFINA